MKWIMLWIPSTGASIWSILFTGRDGQTQTTLGSCWATWPMQVTQSPLSMQRTPLRCAAFAVSPHSTSCSCSAMSGLHLLLLHSRRLIAWKSIFRRGAVLHTLCPPWYSFPFSLCTTLRHFSPDHLHRAVQARLCCKHCRHIIGLGPYHLSMTSYPMP